MEQLPPNLRKPMTVSAIVCRSRNGVIGRDGGIPWHLPDDLKWFKSVTMGHHMIMGRKTFESLPGLLARRPHVVLTRNPDYTAKGASAVSTLQAGIDLAALAGETEAFIIGGGRVYSEAMPLVDRVYQTQVHANFEGDTFFPSLDDSIWKVVTRQTRPADERHAYSFTMSEFIRR